MGLSMRLFLLDKTVPSDCSGTVINHNAEVKYPEDLMTLGYKNSIRSIPVVVNGHEYQVGFWTKLYSVHNWLIRECCNSNSVTSSCVVPIKKAKELVSVCESVLSMKDKNPVDVKDVAGFFSASREHSDDYFAEIKYTKELLESVIRHVESNPRYKIVYRNSW